MPEFKTKQRFYNLLCTTFDEHPEFTASQLLHTLLRKRNDTRDPYFWTDSRLFDELEHIRKDMKQNPLIED
jgi:hypothetical protein